MDAADIAQLLAMASKAQQNCGETPHITMPDGFDLKSLEFLMPQPARIRGVFTTDDPASWVNYVKRLAVIGQSVVLQDDAGLTAIIDFHSKRNPNDTGGPAWCENVAVFNDTPTPEILNLIPDGIPVFVGTFESLQMDD